MILHATLVLVLAVTGTAGDTSNVSLPTFRLPKVAPLKKVDPKQAPTPLMRARAELEKCIADFKRLQSAVNDLSAKIDEAVATKAENARLVKLLDERSVRLVELRECELRLERLKVLYSETAIRFAK